MELTNGLLPRSLTCSSRSSYRRLLPLTDRRSMSQRSIVCVQRLAPMGEVTCYNDSVLDKLLINSFVQAMCKVSGKATSFPDFDGFVDIGRKMSQAYPAEQLHEHIGQVLHSLIPAWVGAIFRAILPPSKFTAEYFALCTTLFSSWLIGPSKVIEIEVNGIKQRSGVHVQKCRFLEHSKCVGMCVNLCKVPSQDFIHKELGVPLTMVPNFDDMSCEFRFGQVPPPLAQDPASQRGCLTGLCPTAHRKQTSCPKLG